MKTTMPNAYGQAVELAKREVGVTPLELCAHRGKDPRGLGGFLLVFNYLVQQGLLTVSNEERWGSKVHYFAPGGHALVRARRRKREAERKEREQERKEAFDKTLKRLPVKKRRNREAKLLRPYDEFLQSDYWKKTREMVLERDGHACVRCKAADKLHVHHRSYAHHGREQQYLEDLETLCEICHAAAHGKL